MAPPTTKQESMMEGLRKLLGDIAQLQMAPDADPQFLMSLQQAISSYAQQQQQGQQQQQAAAMSGGAPGAGAPGGASPMGQGGQMPGLSATGGGQLSDMGGGAGMPNMDELRRALGSSTGAT